MYLDAMELIIICLVECNIAMELSLIVLLLVGMDRSNNDDDDDDDDMNENHITNRLL